MALLEQELELPRRRDGAGRDLGPCIGFGPGERRASATTVPASATTSTRSVGGPDDYVMPEKRPRRRAGGSGRVIGTSRARRACASPRPTVDSSCSRRSPARRGSRHPPCRSALPAHRLGRPGIPAIGRTAAAPPSGITMSADEDQRAYLPVLGSARHLPPAATSTGSGWRCSRAGSRPPTVRGAGPTARPRGVGDDALRPGVVIHGPGEPVLEGRSGRAFRTLHDPASRLTYTVLSNPTAAAWPIARISKSSWLPQRWVDHRCRRFAGAGQRCHGAGRRHGERVVWQDPVRRNDDRDPAVFRTGPGAKSSGRSVG